MIQNPKSEVDFNETAKVVSSLKNDLKMTFPKSFSRLNFKSSLQRRLDLRRT